MGKSTKVKSSTKTQLDVLGGFSPVKFRRFLVDSANLPNPIDYPGHRSQFERWLSDWGRFFTFKVEIEIKSKVRDGQTRISSGWKSTPVPRENLAVLAPVVRTTLNRLWVETEARQRDWYIYRLRDAHRQMVRQLEDWGEMAMAEWGKGNTISQLTDYVLQQIPEHSFFESAMCWLQRHQNLLRMCRGVGCDAPYFLRTGRRHVYCKPCANIARRRAKLHWWNNSPNSPRNRD